MTTVAVVGAHGQIGQLLVRLLAERGDTVLGIVRGAEQCEVIENLGGRGVLADVETTDADHLAHAMGGADAVVFVAGAGPGSGPIRKRTVDYGGSVLSALAAQAAGIRRFVQLSAVGVDEPVADDADESWAAYVEAKRDADAELRASDLAWTILRPGGLTDDPGTGRVSLGPHVGRGSIPRADVAAVLVALLDDDRSIGAQWVARSGETPIDEAVGAALE